MDIEKLKKMNDMSKVLREHGIAAGSEEGSKMASEITKTNIVSEGGESSVLTKDYLEVLLQRFGRQISDEFQKIRNDIAAVKHEIVSRPVQVLQKPDVAEVKETPKVTGTQQIQQNPEPVIQPIQQPAPQPVNKHQITRADVKNGSDPDEIDADVSVEKIFYMGNK